MKKEYRRNAGRGGRVLPHLMFCMLLILSLGQTGVAEEFQTSEQGIVAQLKGKVSELETGMSKAQSEQAHILSPRAFTEARKQLDEAKIDLEKARNIAGVQKKLDEAERYLKQAVANAREGKKQLPDLITARDDALAADAPEYALQLFEEAEKTFNEAMKEMEDGDINGAIKKGKEGEIKYREAELNSIKVNIIGRVHGLLKNAEEMKVERYAPITIAMAKALIKEAENILNSDRSAQATAREKAESAEYEANHALYIFRLVTQYREVDSNWEKMMLQNEEMVREVSRELNFNPRFDAGLQEPLNEIKMAVVSLKDDNQKLTRELEEANAELAEVRKEMTKLTIDLDKTKEQEAGLKARLEEERRKEERIKLVENLFDPAEAKVIREGTNLKLRLVGLSFATGKSEIEAKYFGLLTKVQRAIREFTNCAITIEGHTDAIGHEATNLKLSTERANAVMTYLIANMGLPESRINAVGYGKSQPIASNETEEGRQMNRRIDIVLEIGEAGY